MKMYPYLNANMVNGGKDTEITRGSNRMTELIIMVITVAIGLAIYGQIGPSAVAPGITSSQDTANITGYSTWDTSTQTTYKASGANMALAWFIIPFLFVMGVLKYF